MQKYKLEDKVNFLNGKVLFTYTDMIVLSEKYSSIARHSQAALLCFVLLLLSSCSSSVRFTSGASGSNTAGKYSGGSIGNSRVNIERNSASIGTLPKSKVPIPVGEVQEGVASYYGDGFDGKMTASGTIYNQNQLTAAHRTLPFGSKVKVVNQKNGRQVIVEINDRGPFKGDRIIDLSVAAAQEIDMIKDGIAEVELVVIQ